MILLLQSISGDLYKLYMEGRELWRSLSQKLGETLIETSGAALTNWSPVGNFALSQL